MSAERRTPPGPGGGPPAGDVEVLLEDNHLLAVRKPPGVPSQPDGSGALSLVELAQARRTRVEGKPGAAFVGLVHRLDRNVGGVLLLAKTSKAAARLAAQFRAGAIRKTYLGVAAGTLPAPAEWVDWLRKDPVRNVVACGPQRPGAVRAETLARPLAAARGRTLLELAPRTGRPHQLRVQAAARVGPLLGDVKYGSPPCFAGGLALHALALEFDHPTKPERVRVACPPPPRWRKLLPEFAATLAACG